ncbi:DUF192 domain-containing protein [Patescibacteria group bacterium]|nr:DUF192 domain-containing protein [Patescibacteria group bacterium]MBU4367576.1 DUF192 domain-containing protein [Patescibacteria group bacterium]MBU4461617.1 DUF192 domain-containing protein [Patescibacteria group bacterium]MCG2699514.1 DUF192 domain-containing protein [Candidatus Parcubacteria bacterium]
MKKLLIISILLATVIIIVVTVFLLRCDEKISRICFSNYCFNAEIANTPKTREKGLMFRENIEQNEGMLFIFPEEDIYSFWMKDTLISLDIIWLNSNKEIVFISRNNQPCADEPCSFINPETKAKYVLEINAGIAQETKISVGDKMELK